MTDLAEARRERLALTVAALTEGQTATATFAPRYRAAYDVTGTLEADDSGALSFGGWEQVRLETGLAPGYLSDLVVHAEPLVVAEPAVFFDMAEALYHSGPTAGPSLSHSGAKVLLQGPPARFAYQLAHRSHKSEWDFGHAWHTKVFGVGDPVVEVDARDWRTKAAQAARLAAYDEGMVPMLARDAETVRTMSEVLRADPRVAPLLAEGIPEVSMFGRDPVTGCWIRGRIDWVTPDGTFVDGKTTTDASPDGFNRSVEKFGYAMQAAWYEDLAAQIDGVPNARRFVFVAQEKAAPYLVNVFELDDDWLNIGRALYRRALDVFQACVDADEWPGYGPGITTLSPPPWLLRRELGGDVAESLPAADWEGVDDGFESLLASLSGTPAPPTAPQPSDANMPPMQERTPTSPPDLPEFVTYRHAAQLTGASTDTLRRHTAEGRLPAVRLGGIGPLRVKTSDVLNLIQPA